MKNKILWCPQHQPTAEQLSELNSEVVNLKDVMSEDIYKKLLNCPGDPMELGSLVDAMVEICHRFSKVVLPIGSPAFNFILSPLLRRVKVLFAHSERVSVDEPQADGSVKKVAIFRHLKFIEL